MADLILIAMIPPALGVTYTTADGTPYRPGADGTVDVLPRHVAELTLRGFVAGSTATVPAGDPLALDVGW